MERKCQQTLKTLHIFKVSYLLLCFGFISRDREREMTRAGEEMYLLLTWYVKDASYEILLPPNADMQYFNIKVIHSSTRSGGQKPLLAKEPFLPTSISK